ncbi:MAG: flagellar basal body P-ring formation chaperone FlgA [Ignavibacteriaceae bacterium]|nr:flagellar basal body P-ring formation chaperone FlgA [Ignavibacteriaceae bacterium]
MMTLILSVIIFFAPDGNLKDEVGKYLKEKLSYYQSFEFEIVKVPEKYSSIEIINREIDLRGNIIHLPVKVFESPGKSSISYLSIKLTLFNDALVALKPINKNDKLSASFLEMQKIDVTGVRGTPVKTKEGIELYRAKNNINTGAVITEEHIELLPVVLAGGQIIAHSISGNVVVSVEAFARQDGAEGDVIRVITKEKKLFKARVIDGLNVQILE